MAADFLSKILPQLIECLVRREPVLIAGYSETEILGMLPRLTEHKLESIALLSLEGMSTLKSFYLSTYMTQLTVIRARLARSMRETGCIFLQGFPRCLDFSDFYTPGMRSDVDVYVPEPSLDLFRTAAFSAGFDYYAFDENGIFVVNQQQSDSLMAKNWANKDVALTYLHEVDLPQNFPIEIHDCYLPYLLRQQKVWLMVSIEVHHCYTDTSDLTILEGGREFWDKMGADRCGIEATVYFNLIRLYKGVLAGEKRMRLVLDTACLLLDHRQRLDDMLLKELIASSAMMTQISSVCLALGFIHPVFARLLNASSNYADSGTVTHWLEVFYKSLSGGAVDEE